MSLTCFIMCYRLCSTEVLHVLLCVTGCASVSVTCFIMCYRLCSSEVLPVLLCVTGCAPVKCYLFYSVLQAVLQ